MERSISANMGKGCINHNERKFIAKNVDSERTKDNIVYCNEDIKEAYHKLFDEALAEYNARQKRNDRKIKDYYEKIASGKQEKTFHEVIFQIGDCHNSNAKTQDGKIAAEILDEFMKGFQKRNPNLYVFSAHLHMDEATPHLHIDFIPFIETDGKRGLSKRVSLKSALGAQGFYGGTRSETEWNQWTYSEKCKIAEIMAEYGIEWEHKGNHEKHLSVLEYEKKMRAQEVKQLEEKIDDKEYELRVMERRISDYSEGEIELSNLTRKLNEEKEYQLEEPPTLMSAKTYYTKFALPVVNLLKETAKKLAAEYYRAVSDYRNLGIENRELKSEIARLREDIKFFKIEREEMRKEISVFRKLQSILGRGEIRRIFETYKDKKRSEYHR